MAEQSINYIKTRFETGDRPTGQDFVDLIDTLAANATSLGLVTNNSTTEEMDTEHTVFGIENPTVVDSFLTTEWRVVKYTVSVSCMVNGTNKAYTTELTILNDSEDVNISQYGMIDNNGDIGTVDVSRNGDTVNLRVYPNSPLTPVTVRFYRTGLKA